MDWIKCSERKPEDGQQVLAFVDWESITVRGKKFYDIFYYRKKYGFVALATDDHDGYGGVTHWMPLPEAPVS